MKTRIFKLMAVIALLFKAIPMHSQNYLKIWFKDGHTERHFMHLVQNISATKYDLEGNLHSDYQMQQIVMPDTTYSYYIADIDSMSFRKVDEEKVLSDIKTTAAFVESKLQQNDFTEMESCLSEIISLDGVEDAYFEESSLIVDIVDWGSLCYHSSHDSETDLPDLANFSKVKKRNSLQKTWPITCNNTVKVALLNQQSNDLNRKQYLGMLELQEKFKTMGFDAHYIPSEELSVEFFLDDVFQYDIVYLNTHGIYTKKKHWFMTGEVLSIDKLPAEAEPGLLYQILIGPSKKDVDIDGIIYSHYAEEGRERINEGETETVKVKVYYKTISEEVIANSKRHFEKNRNTIFFNAACQSMKKNDSMAKIYTEGKLSDVYFGYDDDSNTTKDLLAAYKIFEYMLNGYSLEAAMSRLNEEFNNPDPNYEHQNYDLIDQYNYHKNEDGKIDREWIAHLKEVDASDYTRLFIVRTFTEESQKQNIFGEYISNGNVTLRGITSIADKETISNLKCGFCYGLDPTLMISYREVFCDNLEYIENENGNIRFSYPISDIQPGQIIFYRAFTYDGFKHNYGDIKFFTVPKVTDLALSTTAIELTTGETKTVEITSGSGNYSVVTSDPNVAQAEENDGVVTIIGRRPSTEPAIITVTDNVTKQTAAIEVTVTSGESVDVPEGCVDLGLPSGTLWATYNVGANAPEEYGGYYAWGETMEKSSYSTSNYSLTSSITELTADKDVATVMWGDKWRMPTMDEIKELLNECSWSWEEYKGVMGARVTGTNGQSIFLPAGGFKDANDSYAPAPGVYGSYWGRTHNSSYGTELVFGIGDYKNYYSIVDFYYEFGPWGVRSAGRSVRPVYVERHIDDNDYTIFITNPSFDNNIYGGWQGTQLGGYNPDNNAEHYNKNYDTYQTITGLPAGRYQVGVQGFYRKGSASSDYKLWINGDTDNDNAVIYATSSIGSYQIPFVQPSSAALPQSLGGNAASVGTGLYIPDDMVAAGAWFAAGHYHNYLEVEVGNDGKLIIGIKKDTTISGDWTIIDNWTLIKL